ncbi:MAG: hypothetical protein MHM6MM_007207 [Cercozoa sp. M6MM]
MSLPFGRWSVALEKTVAQSPLSYCAVNLKPVLPNHLLIISKRRVARVTQLTDEELADMWQLARRMARLIEKIRGTEAFTFSIQDGKAAGQTVEHVHIHLLPRFEGDFERNDDIYDEIEDNTKFLVDPDAGQGSKKHEVRARTEEEMRQEAAELREQLTAMRL